MTEACLAAGLAVPELEEFATHFRVTLRAAESTEHAQRASIQRTERRTATRDASLLRVLIERSDAIVIRGGKTKQSGIASGRALSLNTVVKSHIRLPLAKFTGQTSRRRPG